MRLCGKNVPVVVGVAPAGSPRPVRLRFGGNTYAMSNDEAIMLANKLADIVGELRRLDERTTP